MALDSDYDVKYVVILLNYQQILKLLRKCNRFWDIPYVTVIIYLWDSTANLNLVPNILWPHSWNVLFFNHMTPRFKIDKPLVIYRFW